MTAIATQAFDSPARDRYAARDASLLRRPFRSLWAAYAGRRINLRKELGPFASRQVKLTEGKSEMVKQWYYDYLPYCPDSGGYFSLGLKDGVIVARSRCEGDHPGPGARDCLFIDGKPLGRNQTAVVPPGATILIEDFVYQGVGEDRDLVRTVVQLVVERV